MVRRFSTIVAVIATACAFYYVASLLIVIRIMRWLGLALSEPLPRHVDICGYQISVWLILALWLIFPATFFSYQIYDALRRRHRDKLDLCLECGYRLRTHRGHCPNCHTRTGPGLPARRYVLNMPRNV